MDNQERANSKQLKIVIIILAVLLGLSAGGLVGRYIYLAFFAPAQSTATVPDNLIGGEPSSVPDENGTESTASAASSGTGSGLPSENTTGSIPAASRPVGMDKPAAPKLELYEGKPGDNQRFEVGNMFPGDVETQFFCVKVYHDIDIDIFFRADITEQTKNLGNVLHIKVTRLETGRVLCDAPFAEIDGMEFSELLKDNAADETTAYYRVDVSLAASAGNEYQAAMLKADFAWYVKDEGGLTPPQTGDTTNIALWIILAVSALLLLLLTFWRRKEARHE